MKMGAVMMAAGLLLGALVPAGLSAQSAPAKGPDTIVYPAKRGAVTFTHAKHAELGPCVSCHHESRPEKPLESEYQKCSACHTEPATPPVKTGAKGAMHDTVNKEGVCYTCHTAEAAAGKTVPMKCADCHIKDE